MDIEALAKKAQDRKTIYPALDFSPNGNKTAEGRAVVRFREIGLNPVKNPKAKKGQPEEFLVTHVDLLEASDFGQQPGIYQLQTAATNSSLTDGILKVWMQRNRNLEGAVVAIETYNYMHPKYGQTRGYRVSPIQG